MAALFGLLFIATLFVPRVAEPQGERTPVWKELRGFAAMLAAGVASFLVLRELPWELLGAHRLTRLAADTVVLAIAFVIALLAARRAGFPSFVEPWDAFFARERAVALLALIVFYKLGDAFAGALSTSFLIRGAGFSAAEVGAVNKILGLAATIVGVIAGGAWLARKPLHQALLLFGLLQAVSNLGYWLVAIMPRETVLMAFAVGLENLCGGLGTAAFVALLMALTERRFSAAQFALLSALSAVGRVYVGPLAAILVEMIGWPVFFLVTVAAAIPGIVLVIRLSPVLARL
jgi:PAT family beta-lactamase induction signal transducer AmpG